MQRLDSILRKRRRTTQKLQKLTNRGVVLISKLNLTGKCGLTLRVAEHWRKEVGRGRGRRTAWISDNQEEEQLELFRTLDGI